MLASVKFCIIPITHFIDLENRLEISNFEKFLKPTTMIEYFSNNLWQFWAILCIVGLILELMSGDFFILCFSIGTFCSILASLCGAGFVAQIIIFAIASALSLWLVRPAMLKWLPKK